MINRHPNAVTSEALAEEAAFWCMRLHADDCTHEERAAFDRWLHESPAHGEEYRNMLEIWNVSALLPRGETTAREPIESLRPAHRFPLRRFATAAAVLLFTGLFCWERGLLPSSYQRYTTRGELNKLELPDGSEVQMNRNTSLSFSNFRDRRQVSLNNGEAFFHVTHSASHPFVVLAGSGRIVVTGTRFNVWKYNEQVVVTLTEGSVSVLNDKERPHPSTVRLSPGKQARYGDSDEPPRIGTASPEDTTAWREGKLILNNVPLAEALPMINRYLQKPVRLASSAGNIRIGGIFNTDNIDGLVRSLPKVLPVQIVQNERGELVIENRKP